MEITRTLLPAVNGEVCSLPVSEVHHIIRLADEVRDVFTSRLANEGEDFLALTQDVGFYMRDKLGPEFLSYFKAVDPMCIKLLAIECMMWRNTYPNKDIVKASVEESQGESRPTWADRMRVDVEPN